MNPSIGVEITALLLLVVGLVAFIVLTEYVVYVKAKKLGYRITYRQMLRLQIIVLKPAIIDMARVALLWIIMIFPLSFISASTDLSIALVVDLLLGKVRSPLPGAVEITLSFLFLLANITAMHYFLGKYGSIYKLPVVLLTRDNIIHLNPKARGDVRQFLDKHKSELQDILMGLMVGSVTYVMVIMSILVALINTPSFISKISAVIVVTLLLSYVLFNEKYENAIKLIEKIWSK